MKKLLKTPISYYGGKQNMIPHLLPLIPEHSQYVEPFCGGAAMLFAKPISKAEVMNDLDGRLITFWRTLQTQYNELKRLIDATPHSENLHQKASFILDNMFMFDDIHVAWAVWVQTNMSFSCMIQGGFAFSNSGQALSAANKITEPLKKNYSLPPNFFLHSKSLCQKLTQGFGVRKWHKVPFREICNLANFKHI